MTQSQARISAMRACPAKTKTRAAAMTSPASDPVWLAPGVGFALCENQAIVLDVRADRYLRLDRTTGMLLDALGSGEPVSSNAFAMQRLHDEGLITNRRSAPGLWLLPGSIAAATTSPLDGREGTWPLSRRDLVTVMDCLRARRDLARHSLISILTSLPADRPCVPATDLEVEAARFDRARRFAPAKPRCLPDALAFVRRMRRAGNAVHLVFGVKVHPFEAHCWAQHESTVLTDPLERVLRFKPVLAI